MRRASALSFIATTAIATTAIATTVVVCLQAAVAQSVADGLTETQRSGRQIFAQSCGVCHLPPAINARTYGPALSKETASGNDEIIRGLISDGTPRMPAFKYYLERPQIDAVIAYLKTVPTPAPAPATQTR
jgi:mono/diheme cytochrome c family protein